MEDIFANLIIYINQINNNYYNIVITDNMDINYNDELTIEKPSIGNITLNNDTYIYCIRFARTFENEDLFFAEIKKNNILYKKQLFVD